MGRHLFGVRKHPVLGDRVRAAAKTLAEHKAGAKTGLETGAKTGAKSLAEPRTAAPPPAADAPPPSAAAPTPDALREPAPKKGSIRIHALVEDSPPAEDNDLSKLPDDRDLADRILRACNELQEAMDTAVLAGLIIEPSFSRIEGRLTRAGVKVDSFACSVKVFRKLA